MKPNRVQRKTGKKTVSSQAGIARKKESAKSQTAPAAIPILLHPGQAAQAMIEALAAYRVRINEAGSLALLFAARIRTGVKDFAEWSDFDRHIGFADGVRELALTGLTGLRTNADAYGVAHAGMVEALRGLTAPVPPLPSDGPADQLIQKYGYNFGNDNLLAFERSKDAMCDLLDMMGDTFSERNGDAGHSIAYVISEALNEAFDRVWKTAHALREATLAVEWQRFSEQSAAA